MSKVVLLVEDEDFIRDMYKFKLAKSGLTVIEATDGKEALEKLSGDLPDVVLLDLMMPNVSGIEVLKHLRKQNITPDLPVIVLTNVMDSQIVAEAKELGARDYFVKTDLTPSQVAEGLKQFI